MEMIQNYSWRHVAINCLYLDHHGAHPIMKIYSQFDALFMGYIKHFVGKYLNALCPRYALEKRINQYLIISSAQKNHIDHLTSSQLALGCLI